MARKGNALSFLSGTLTQSGADAYIQLTLATALSGQTKVSYRMASLEIELPRVGAVDLSDQQFSITRKTYAAMPTSMYLEKSCIFYYRRQTMTPTSAGFAIYDRTIVRLWNDQDAPIIVEDPIYAQFDTNATTYTGTAYFRLGYWVDSISEVDRLTLVANSLS